jgi:hypothetical protein
VRRGRSVRRRASLGLLAAGLVMLVVLAAFLGRPPSSSALLYNQGGGTEPAGAGVGLDQSSKTVLVLRTPVYRLTLSKGNGGFVSLVDASSGEKLITATNGCEWGASELGSNAYSGGCAFAPGSSSRFSYSWDSSAATLTMTYATGSGAQQHVDAVVTLHAEPSYFDLRLTLTNHAPEIVQTVNFPVDLYFDSNVVQTGYAPNFLPGVRFGPAFFQRVVNDVFTYPSRWAFADYLALDIGSSHLAMYSVNPPPAPLAPVDLGFLRNNAPAPCSGTTFCITHAFHTWLKTGDTWSSPVVRIRVGDPVDHTILDYRTDNGIDAYPSAATKLGPRLETLARAPLIKADLENAAVPGFGGWADALDQLPTPALIHPVGFGPRGFDATDPDVLPPGGKAGTLQDLQSAFAAARTHGDLVMPYLNVSWWNPESPTVQALPTGLTSTGVSVQDTAGNAEIEDFSGFEGLIVSPSVPYVRQRAQAEIEQWTTGTPADCLFFDQIGARPWRYDFNPDATSPLDYDDGWLSLFAPYSSNCLMVEDGWDRLGASFSGFDSSLMLMQREFDWLDQRFGPDWQTFPLALWLLHDKVLMYQHDLFDLTFTTDPEMLTWNLAYGYMLSYNWGVGLDSPWLQIVTAFQQALGPHYAGVALTGYAQLATGVTQTRFGTYSVIDNQSGSTYAVDGYSIASGGFLARTDDGSLVAGEFADPSGSVYRIVQGGATTFSMPVPAPG